MKVNVINNISNTNVKTLGQIKPGNIIWIGEENILY